MKAQRTKTTKQQKTDRKMLTKHLHPPKDDKFITRDGRLIRF